jgi:hypothetical protein
MGKGSLVIAETGTEAAEAKLPATGAELPS